MLLPHSVVFKNQCACNTGPALTSVANIRYPAAMVGPASIPLRQRLREAANQIHLRTPLRPRIALLLSTGHGSIANQLKDKITVHQTDLPAGLHLTAPLLIGMLEGVPVALADAPLMPFGGGHADLLHPIQLMHALGSELLVLTAGAASLCQQIEAGTLAVVEDHLNFSGTQPLQGGGSDQLGPSFPICARPIRAASSNSRAQSPWALACRACPACLRQCLAPACRRAPNTDFCAAVVRI